MQSYSLIGTTGTLWGKICGWSVAVDYRLFRKNRLRWRGGRAAFYIRLQIECTKLCLGMDDKTPENLWIRISGQTNMGMFPWVSATDYLIRKKKKMRPSPDNWKKSHIYRLWFSWRTLIILICARGTAQQDTI